MLANLAAVEAYLVDSEGSRVTDAVLGQKIGVRLDWVTAALHSNIANYQVGFRVLGGPSSESRLLGEYWWFGRASTHCWTNPSEGLTAIILEQRKPSPDLPFDSTFAAVHPLIYGAIEPTNH